MDERGQLFCEFSPSFSCQWIYQILKHRPV